MTKRSRAAAKPPAKTAVPDLDHISIEYAEAIELIHTLRNDAPSPCHDQLRHWSLPASKISADFFCVAEHPKKGLFAFLADSAGHGLAAAIFALQTPLLFREAVQRGTSLTAIYENINRFLIRQRITNYFVCGILVRIQGRELEIVNAGMPDGLLLDEHGQIHGFPSLNLPFGVDGGLSASAQSYHLARNDKAGLLLYSDGLSDLTLPRGRTLGIDGIKAAATVGKDAVLDTLIDLAKRNLGNAHDDISVAMIPIPLASDHGEHLPEPAGGIAGALAADQPVDVGAALRIVEHIDHGLLITDAEQQILYVNPAFTTITGYPLEEVAGQTPRILNSGRQGAGFYREMWHALLDLGCWSGEIWNRRKDGSTYLEWLELRAIRDQTAKITHFIGTFTPLADHERSENRIRQLAKHDPLTGIANRILLVDRGEQAILRANRTGHTLAVLFIDLDRFMSINDSLGHEIGDLVLTQVARRLECSLREEDTLSRFFGDEFILLLPDIDERSDAALVAKKLLVALESPIEVAGHVFKVGASIGICVYGPDARLFDDLIVMANRAMQRAKQAGGNIYRFYSPELASPLDRQLEREARLDAAIRNGELELHYQPKLDLRTRDIVGAEALVRWRDPQHGLIPPGMFIPIAERSDLIAKIGNWVLNQACAALARWEGRLPEKFHVAINVSPLQFERCDLASELGAALASEGISPARLQIEVTESLFIRNTEEVARTLHEVAELGVSIALDDFGTGYSNLGTLNALPLDTFKLDQSFVRDVESKPASSSIAKAVWHMADELDKQVVAEGIETCAECLKIQSLGYTTGQGYKFGKPMPEKDFLEHLRNWQPCICPLPESANQ